jgi:D-arabinose 5-phosphate isomerase GutQ
MENTELFKNACEMWDINAEELKKLRTGVNPDEYAAVFNAIKNCKGRIATVGMGTSSVAARKIAHMLCVANVPSFFVSAGDAAHGAFGAVQQGDAVIALSKGGNTEELVNLIESIKGKGLTLITVTQDGGSELAKASDIVIHLKVAESDHKHMLPTASIVAIISIFDAIADELTKCPQFSERAFYLNHNHGSVGALLKDKLEENK